MPEKEDYITQCVNSGKSKEECETAWNEAHKEGDKGYTTAIKENEMLKVQLRQSIDIIKQQRAELEAANMQKDAATEARKYELAQAIALQTDQKPSELMTEDIDTLFKIQKAVDSKTKGFVSVSSLIDESDAKRKPMLTVGEWDPVTKKYRGGV